MPDQRAQQEEQDVEAPEVLLQLRLLLERRLCRVIDELLRNDRNRRHADPLSSRTPSPPAESARVYGFLALHANRFRRCPPPPIHCAPWRGSSSRGGRPSTGRPSIRTRRSPPPKARSTRASSPAIGSPSRASTTAWSGSRSSTASAASMLASRSTIRWTGPSPGSAARSPSGPRSGTGRPGARASRRCASSGGPCWPADAPRSSRRWRSSRAMPRPPRPPGIQPISSAPCTRRCDARRARSHRRSPPRASWWPTVR